MNIFGKEMKGFIIELAGETINVILAKGQYTKDGSLAIRAYSVDTMHGKTFLEPFGTLTVNTGLETVGNCQFVKTWSENEGWAGQIADRVGEDTGIYAESDYAIVHLYRFRQDALDTMADITAVEEMRA